LKSVSPISDRRATSFRRFSLGIITAALALALRGTLGPIVGLQYPYVSSFAAVGFSAWYGGLWPGTMTAILCWLGVDYFFVPPLHDLGMTNLTDWLGTIMYLISSGTIISIGEMNRRTLRKYHDAQTSLVSIQGELEKRIEERTAELVATNEGLRELSSRLIRVRDEEQRRIARDLHDSTGQILASLAMGLSSIRIKIAPLSSALADALCRETEKGPAGIQRSANAFPSVTSAID
jgi:signal transduction histidine kinase